MNQETEYQEGLKLLETLKEITSQAIVVIGNAGGIGLVEFVAIRDELISAAEISKEAFIKTAELIKLEMSRIGVIQVLDYKIPRIVETKIPKFDLNSIIQEIRYAEPKERKRKGWQSPYKFHR